MRNIILEENINQIFIKNEKGSKGAQKWLISAVKQCLKNYVKSKNIYIAISPFGQLEITLREIPLNRNIHTGYLKLLRRAHRKALEKYPQIYFKTMGGKFVSADDIITRSEYDGISSLNGGL